MKRAKNMKDMKQMNMKNIFNWIYDKMLDREMSGRRSREDRAINSIYRPISVLNVVRMSLVCLFTILFSGQVWGAWSGSGQGTLINGTWYVLYEENENSINTIGNKSFDLLGPGSQITFEAKRTPTGLKNLKVTDGTTKFFDENPGTVVKKILGIESQVDYTTYGPYDINMDATSIKFYTETGATYSKYFRT